MLVLDYSGGKPGAAAIAAAGYRGAVRYIGFPTRTKCTDATELNDYSAHGLGMALVYEDHADDWRGGFDAGRQAGARARQHADAIGFPWGRPIYMAVDRDVVSGGEFDAAVAYLRGAAVMLGGVALTGVYGEHDVCAAAQQAGAATWFWQCRAWSGTPPKLFPGRHLYQRVATVQVGGISCDVNEVLAGDWGQHNNTREAGLSWKEDLTFTPPNGAPPITYNAGTWLMWTNWYANLIPAVGAVCAQILEAVTKDPDITADRVHATLTAAVTAAMPTAQDVAVAQRPFLADLVREVVPAEQADQLVDALARRLATTPPPPAPAGRATTLGSGL